MKGAKPGNIHLIASRQKQAGVACPAWLPAEAKAEWNRAVKDLSSRGLMSAGALASLEHYVLCIAQIRQLQRILAETPIADADGIHPAYHAQQKAVQSARLLAVELGLSVVSRARSFQGKAADEREWDELGVG